MPRVRGVRAQPVCTFTHTRLDEWSVTWKAICAAAAARGRKYGGQVINHTAIQLLFKQPLLLVNIRFRLQ
jgi:hypothetical protein